MVYWIGYGLTYFPNFQSATQDYATEASHNTAIYFLYYAFVLLYRGDDDTRSDVKGGF